MQRLAVVSALQTGSDAACVCCVSVCLSICVVLRVSVRVLCLHVLCVLRVPCADCACVWCACVRVFTQLCSHSRTRPGPPAPAYRSAPAMRQQPEGGDPRAGVAGDNPHLKYGRGLSARASEWQRKAPATAPWKRSKGTEEARLWKRSEGQRTQGCGGPSHGSTPGSTSPGGSAAALLTQRCTVLELNGCAGSEHASSTTVRRF